MTTNDPNTNTDPASRFRGCLRAVTHSRPDDFNAELLAYVRTTIQQACSPYTLSRWVEGWSFDPVNGFKCRHVFDRDDRTVDRDDFCALADSNTVVCIDNRVVLFFRSIGRSPLHVDPARGSVYEAMKKLETEFYASTPETGDYDVRLDGTPVDHASILELVMKHLATHDVSPKARNRLVDALMALMDESNKEPQ